MAKLRRQGDKDLIESGQVTEARRAKRRSAKAPSTMRSAGIEPIDVIVLDISRSGVRIVTDAELEIGQEISIGLAGAGVTRAYVRWANGGEYGCAFERPIAAEDEALAFSHAPVKRLGRAPVKTTSAESDDYLRELYRNHRVWALPWDATLMVLAMLVLCGLLFRL